MSAIASSMPAASAEGANFQNHFSTQSSICSLSKDLKFIIFSFLDVSSLFAMRSVSREWNTVVIEFFVSEEKSSIGQFREKIYQSIPEQQLPILQPKLNSIKIHETLIGPSLRDVASQINGIRKEFFRALSGLESSQIPGLHVEVKPKKTPLNFTASIFENLFRLSYLHRQIEGIRVSTQFNNKQKNSHIAFIAKQIVNDLNEIREAEETAKKFVGLESQIYHAISQHLATERRFDEAFEFVLKIPVKERKWAAFIAVIKQAFSLVELETCQALIEPFLASYCSHQQTPSELETVRARLVNEIAKKSINLSSFDKSFELISSITSQALKDDRYDQLAREYIKKGRFEEALKVIGRIQDQNKKEAAVKTLIIKANNTERYSEATKAVKLLGSSDWQEWATAIVVKKLTNKNLFTYAVKLIKTMPGAWQVQYSNYSEKDLLLQRLVEAAIQASDPLNALEGICLISDPGLKATKSQEYHQKFN